ncbi:putative Cystatin domain-containing protein [Helianthus annuus]|nr:putative Cystatin domain-containing protein [Helianthus annuus]KAJ0623846.1 putative Cystatin domain-containing protein [Helianthus annuus]
MAKFSLAVTTITFSIIILISISTSVGIRLGGRTKIDDVKTNKEIQAMGKYSVEEYNRLRRNSEEELTFSQVVEAEQQVVAGMKYYLTIETLSKTSGDPKVFQAVVEVKPWLHSKKLLKFAPSTANLLPVTLICLRRIPSTSINILFLSSQSHTH